MNLRKPVSFLFLTVALHSCGHHASQPAKPTPADTTTPTAVSSPANALTQLNLLIKTDSLNADAWYEKGLLLAEMKDTLPAIKALETSFFIKPLQLSGIALANLYAETKNERALALSNTILKKDTAHSLIDPVFIKGIYYTKTGQEQQALTEFDECIKRDWKFIEAYIEKGIIQYNQKKLPVALKTFKLAATVSSNYADAYFWIGKCFEVQGQKKEAAENYAKALSLDKDFTEASEALKRINIL